MLKIDAKDLKTVDWSDDDKGPAVGQLLATAAQGELPKGIGVVSVPRRAIPVRAADAEGDAWGCDQTQGKMA